MDKYFHLTLYQACDYLSMLGLKLNHVSKRGPWIKDINYLLYLKVEWASDLDERRPFSDIKVHILSVENALEIKTHCKMFSEKFCVSNFFH